MKTFTIENETNNITIHPSAKEADAVPNSERFGNETALAKLAVDWPAGRLIAIWNSLPGVNPVQKFKDRTTAVSRIWKALQSLGEAAPAATVVEKPAPVPETAAVTELPETAPVPEQDGSETPQSETVVAETTEPAVATDVAQRAPDVAPEAAPAKKKATREKKAPKAATNAGAPREGSKSSQVIEMLKREGGTTLEEIMTAMGWQKHTTRAMLSAADR